MLSLNGLAIFCLSRQLRATSHCISGPDPQSSQHNEDGKAASQSNVIADMLKLAGEEGIEMVRRLVEAVFCNSEIPRGWEVSYSLNLFKVKG